MTNEQIKELGLSIEGLELKEQPDGSKDFHPYIYELVRAALARACQPQWISVDDALPNNLQQVLIAHEEGGVMQAVYDECFAYGKHKRRFLTPYAQEIYDAVGDYVEITHWMQLPTPPKGD